MGIKLTILPHQTECIASIFSVFEALDIVASSEISANPIFDKNDINLKNNISEIQDGKHGTFIPKCFRTNISDEFGIDIKMETGTGKTYCYTRLMYELNKLYGFYKFIILVPTTPIKEGTYSFINSEYAKQHFADLYPNARMDLFVLNSQKKTKGRKMFPQAVADFSRTTILEKNRISTLLMSSGMLVSKRTMDYEYDQTLLGNYTKPYDALKATRPIVIIDEPHKFKRENIAYKRLIEKINPLCVIRFGATFPDVGGEGQKDYNNLIFNLGACEAFNNNLVKGVETQFIEQETLNETRVKVLDISTSNPQSCIIRNEKTNKSYSLSLNSSLSVVSEDFQGVTIQKIGKTDEETIKKGITLSNGQILEKGDQIYAGIYSNTYQELMLKQAIQNHIERVAMSQAYIGYDLQNALHEELLNRGIKDLPTMTMVTQVLVDQNDPAFQNPTKPIGHFMTQEEAEYAEKNYDYVVKEDAGRGYRRVVASPAPKEIIELEAIKGLVGKQLIVACGGGGIPVTKEGNELHGAAAVIDKDWTSSLLAQEIDADVLVILTAVEKVAINFGKENEKWLDEITVTQAKEYVSAGEFAEGSMKPKVEAAIAFAESKKGRVSIITLLEKSKDGIAGKTGTRIVL